MSDKLVKDCLVQLSRVLDGDEAAKRFNDCLGNHFEAETQSHNIAKCLENVLEDPSLFVTPGTLTENVLRMWQQETIQPAVMQLRTSIYTMYPYQDMRGSWGVHVNRRHSRDEGSIEVDISHRKWEVSRSAPNFSFQWECRVTFSGSDCNIRKVHVGVVDYHFPEETPAGQRRAVLAVLRPWFPSGLPFSKIINSY